MPHELFHKGSRGDTARFNRKKNYMYPKDTLTEWNVNKTFAPNQHLPIQNQLWKHQNIVRNMFKVNNKDTRATPMRSFWCLYY